MNYTVVFPIVAIMVTYCILWIGGVELDHRGIDTMLCILLIITMGFMGFILAKIKENS